jgi:hypothetical protein
MTLPRPLVFAVLFALPAFAAAKDRTPWSELSGTGADLAQPGDVDVVVVRLDGEAYTPCDRVAARRDSEITTGSLVAAEKCATPRSKLKFAPGTHATIVATTRVERGAAPDTQPYSLQAEACVRYRLAARHADGAAGFEVIVAGREPIKGCIAPAAVADGNASVGTDATPQGSR